MEAATAADLTQASEIAGRYITLGSAARASRPVPGLVLEVQVMPKMSVPAQIIKNGPNRVQNQPFGLKLGPETCQDRSGAFGMGLTHCKGPSPAKKIKKCARAAPGLASRYITLGIPAKGYVSGLTVVLCASLQSMLVEASSRVEVILKKAITYR